MSRSIRNLHVCRRLFADEDTIEEASNDNLTNINRELIERDKLRLKEVWNFDSETESQADENGTIEWFTSERSGFWIGKVRNRDLKEEPKVHDENMQEQNETTPKTKEDQGLPDVRKRKKEDSSNAETVKRRISFD